jgi:2-amino-4-hydroxy-6-hydroxymethyldihydropteridine diphosphokinase
MQMAAVKKEFEVYLALGSNLGNRLENLIGAVGRLKKLSASPLVLSSVYETEPVGVEGGTFYNLVVAFKTILEPDELMERLLEIEKSFGRVRKTGKVLPRTLDIDLLFYGNEKIKQPTLEIPHPRWAEREFVLVPLAEIAPGLVDPVRGTSISRLLDERGHSETVRWLGKLEELLRLEKVRG